MKRNSPSLFELLPELYRCVDGLAGGSLEALSEVLDTSRRALESDMAALYADWFVETCGPEVLPRLAQLTGWEGPPAGAHKPRAMIADRIAFARAKGTAPATARWLSDLGGWPVSVRHRGETGAVEVTVNQQPTTLLRHVSPAPAGTTGCYHLHPLGIDTAINPAATPDGALALAYRDAAGAWQQLAPEHCLHADLSHWGEAGHHHAPHPLGVSAWVDPRLGRLRVIDPALKERPLLASFACAALRTLPRRQIAMPPARAEAEWLALVHGAAPREHTASTPPVFRNLADALHAFRKVGLPGRIRLLDSATHHIGRHSISDHALTCLTDPNQPHRLTIEAAHGETPTLRGALRVHASGPGLDLALRGISVDGTVTLAGRVSAQFADCVIRPAAHLDHAIRVLRHRGHHPRLDLAGCAVGAIIARVHSAVTIADSIVDGRGAAAIAGGGTLHLSRVTALGGVHCGKFTASDSLFGAAVLAIDAAQSSAEHCWLPPGSSPVRLHHCLTGAAPPHTLFAAVEPGAPGYAMLSRQTGADLRRAASNGGEMGAFNGLHIAGREDLIEQALNDIMPLASRWSTVWTTGAMAMEPLD